ncbi:MAG: cysteine--tRNA ligase, partial [Actinomycetota bacterium]|nr:cysteine--tRNA ligase [Actinomycetota bacterium]
KMSKSLGNFMLLKDVLAVYTVPVVRLFMLQTHYRSPLEFSTDRLDEARTAFERIENLVRNLEWAKSAKAMSSGAPSASRELLASARDAAREKFVAEMDDDFNTAGALGAIFEFARAANTFLADNQSDVGVADIELLVHAKELIIELLAVLGVVVAGAVDIEFPPDVVGIANQLAGYAGTDPEEAVRALLAARAAARAERNWTAADAVRDGLAMVGLVVEDTAQGARVTYRAVN